MQNEYVEIAVFFYLKLMKEQLQALSSESQIRVLFLWETPRPLK